MTRTEAKKCPAMGHALSSKSSIGPKDIYTLEALSHFNREKIPERAVHALGAGAYGEFEVTHDISDICNIDMLLGVGKKTPLVTRFSTTGLERGSSDGVQDLKGMATKFFTKDGEWDWVFLNFPFFFIRDPAKFPDMIHSQRRDPQTNRLNPNMFWDFVTDNHESIHMTLLQHSDFGRMFTWRTLSSYAGHAFKWTMPNGSFKYVHFFLASDRGPNFTDGTGATMDPSDPDFGSKDLFEAIERGDYPSWTANVQVVDPKDAAHLGFNILDITKHWNLGTYPQGVEKIPSRPFGKLTLNRNVTDYFTEVEQLAFSPSHMVPGVEASEDPILQARMFAYPDAQRYRLGAIPRAPPTRMPSALKSEAELGPEFAKWVAQVSSDEWSGSHDDDYKFAREYYEVLPDFRSQDFQDRMVERIVVSVSQTRQEIRDKVYRTFALVSSELAHRVKDGVEKFDESSKVQVTQSRL
ncbi:CAZyme family AA7 [Penicillium soppii]|uniref:CAZyme family AA7 n=1 Tax=Penicillium soppii TaxID=69789 RepID=UPI0025491AB3|nr:CAZyme family AA7 [Penicillium soppii]KAJ5882372.1 CAZyme family AA7 [Penicillium soppii]